MRQTGTRWVRWALIMGLTCWSAVSLAVAPVEDAQPDGGVSVSDAEEVTYSAAPVSVPAPEPARTISTPQRTRWEDTSDQGSFDQPAASRTHVHSDEHHDDTTVTLAQVSQQVNNIAGMNLPGRLDELQQTVAKLRGQLQVQAHAIKRLEAQRAKVPSVSVVHAKPHKLFQRSKPQPASIHTGTESFNQHAYTVAFDALMSKQYGQAKTGFLAYIHDYPQGTYISNAYYWLAEIALVKREYTEAEKRLTTVVTQYPTSSKYPDARYKLAMTHLRMHQTAKAKQELQALTHDFSGKTVGRLAGIALEQLDLD